MHCQLLIPGFFSHDEAPAAVRLVAAETLVSKGRRKRLPASSHEAWLFERFQIARQRDWPVAPYALLADGGSPGPDFWMRADPVHLRAGNDSIVLIGVPPSGISRGEAQALAETLNRHFGESLQIDLTESGRWYARLQPVPEAQTTPVAAAQGEEIKAQLPSGRDAMRLRALMNETQMLLHEHAVNIEREARGEPALNSLWLWGGGAIERAPARPFSAVIADDPLARGLALAAGIPARRLPQDAGVMLASPEEDGAPLVVLNAPQNRDGCAALERDWLKPLLAALHAGRIGMLSLCLLGADAGLEVETVRSDLRCFWRRKKPLKSYLA
ncbi:MAG TPA: regulator [Burkholderiales bacterium]|jgi:hypothetical protein